MADNRSASVLMSEKKTLVLIGTTGTGKSTLGNVLLGYKPSRLVIQHDAIGRVSDGQECAARSAPISGSTDDVSNANEEGPFKRSSGAQSCTLECSSSDGFFLGDQHKPIRIIDTPGHGDSLGRDHSFRDEVIATMKREKKVHAFLLTKNAQAPRVDMQDIEFFDILRKIFGPGFFANLVVVFTRFHYSSVDEDRREREQTTLESQMEGFRKELGDTDGRIPIVSIDALYTESDKKEVEKFKQGCERLWTVVQKFSETPVEDLENIQAKKSALEQELEELMKRQQEMMDEDERTGADHDPQAKI